MKLYAILMLAALACAPLVARAQAATSYDDVLMMVNDSSANSVDIANYFAQRRHIVPWHMFHFQHDTATSDYGETTDSARFKREILWPLQTFMRTHNLIDSINYIVCTKGCPLRVSAPANSGSFQFPSTSSFTDCIALANGRDSVYMLTNKQQPIGSRYFTTGPLAHFQHNQSTMPYYLTARLDAYTVDQVKAMILRSESPAYLGQGIWVNDVAPTFYPEGNTFMKMANDSLVARGLSTVLDTTKVYLTKQKNVIGYCSWGSNDPDAATYAAHAIPGNTYVNGAIAETFVSTGGRSFNPGTGYGQSLIADWIAEGVTAIKGYTDEPYTLALAIPYLLFPRYADGYNVAESFWSSSQMIAWRQVLIGDPKMTLRRPVTVTTPQVDFGAAERYAPVTRRFSLKNTGTNPVTVKSYTFSGGDSTPFTVSAGSLPRQIAARDSVTFTVTFRGVAYGAAGSTLHIPYHLAGVTADMWEPVELTGTVIRPTLSSPDTIEFPATATLSTSDSAAVLTNAASSDTITITGAFLTGTEFSLRGPSPSTNSPLFILPGQSLSLPLSFVPQDTGMRQTTLQIRSNATSPIKFTTIVLRGRGMTPSPVHDDAAVLDAPTLSEAFPNPSAGVTLFTVHTVHSVHGSPAALQVFDVIGRMVADLTNRLPMDGDASIRWDAASLPDGMYLCRLVCGGAVVERHVLRLH